MKTTNTESIQESKQNCCTGTHFWVWASIRIAIVVTLIVGAFFLGARCSYERGYDKKGMSNRPSMMMDERGHSGRDDDYLGARQDQKAQQNPGSHDMMDMSMRDMGAMLEGKTGAELNKAFLEGMIPHHQGAVEMAKYLEKSDKPELRQMGQDIIKAQTTEIEQMKKWMIEWGYTQSGTTKTGTMNVHVMSDGTMMQN